ncbi:unnamed protein product, partial [Iphiclides podalirius]
MGDMLSCGMFCVKANSKSHICMQRLGATPAFSLPFARKLTLVRRASPLPRRPMPYCHMAVSEVLPPGFASPPPPPAVSSSRDDRPPAPAPPADRPVKSNLYCTVRTRL